MNKLIKSKISILALCLLFIHIAGTGFTLKAEEPQQSEDYVKFKIKNLGLTVDGQFHKFSKTISYDKENPEKSKFKGTIGVASIDTNIKKRDTHLLKEEYFHAEKYEQISFESTSVKKIQPNRLQVLGTITIKGVKKNIELQVNILENGDKTQLLIAGILNRRDFEVGGYSLVLSDEVLLDIKVQV
jgi:polyisoprenoid-binding protein YceI